MPKEDLLTQKIMEVAEPLAASLGLDIWGIEVGLGPRSLVRVYVESEQGVSIDQCAELSRLMGLSLDVEDIMPAAYTLEVSSPGLERVFFTQAQLGTAVGKTIEVTLLHPTPLFPGRKRFRGTLAQKKDGVFSLLVEDCARPGEDIPVLEFTFADAKRARQTHAFPEKKPPVKGAGKKNQDVKVPQKSSTSGQEASEGEQLRPLTQEEQDLLAITGGCEAL